MRPRRPRGPQQRVAELDAGRRLLKAVRVRVEALMAVIKPALEYPAKKFVDNAISALGWDFHSDESA